MKKIAKLIVTSAIASSIATSAIADSKSMTGFYVGTNVGYGAGTDYSKVPGGDKKDIGLKGTVGGLHLGFQRDFGQFVAGLEGSASLSNTKGSYTDDGDKTTVKRKDAYGIAARLGVKLNSWLAYAKFGYETAKFADRFSFTNYADTKNKRLGAFVPGIGFETMFCDHWLIGGEWTYALYKGKKFTHTFNNVAGVENGTTTEKHKPRIGDFKLRLGYKF